MEPIDESRPGGGPPATAPEPDKAAGDDLAAEWAMPFMPADDAPDFPADEPTGRRGSDPPPYSGGTVVRQPVAWYVPLLGRLLMLGALVMLVMAIAGGVAGIGVPARDTYTYSVPLTIANPTVHIGSTASNVHVQTIPPGGANAVTVVESIEVRNISPSLAQRSLDAARIAEPTVSNGVVEINARPQEDWGILFQRDVSITITLPQDSNLQLDMQAGNITVEGTSGQITGTISAGNLDLLGVKVGDGSRVQVNAGNVRLDGELLPNASLDMEVNAGNATILLPFNTDARLTATADGGHLDIDGWAGLTTATPNVKRGNRPEVITGVLYTNPNPTSQITINVNAGHASLRPGDSRPAPSIPPAPSAPPLPSVPPRP
jgi:hypothetical protein